MALLAHTEDDSYRVNVAMGRIPLSHLSYRGIILTAVNGY
ncbi:Uncharacterised protein [Serratia proteamaculans]|nr:Uncharacterised protein [Serratia proteamaculans]